MADREKLELSFAEERKTKRTVLFQEVLNEEAYSDKDVAIGPLYVQKQALEMIGNPGRIKVTIEPV